MVESTSARLENIGIGLIAIAGLIAAGYWLLNPLFRLLAAAKAREVMKAAALLVVLGAALLMQVSGWGHFLQVYYCQNRHLDIRLKRILNRFVAYCSGYFFWA